MAHGIKTQSTKSTPRRLQDSQQSLTAQQRSTETRVSNDGTVVIADDGDVVLDFSISEKADQASFRVEAARLGKASLFFQRLLLDVRFAEGKLVSEYHQNLKFSYSEFAAVPVAELPHVSIEDVGQISAVKSIRPLIRDLLLISHGLELSVTRLPLTNVANLVIAADRFDCIAAVAHYVQTRGLLTISRGAAVPTNEESVRQRLLIAFLLRFPQNFGSLSRDLMLAKSDCWSRDPGKVYEEALWWSLPRGLEEEIRSRRRYVLMAISSLQSSIFDAYTSRARQCKLGYDTSPQCDSFQCGEFVRFLARKDLLRLESSLHQPSSETPFCDSIESLIETLRNCPSYQIDGNHTHCGPRKMLLQGLSVIEAYLTRGDGPGICLDCWYSPSSQDRSWAVVKPLPIWSLETGGRHIGATHKHGSPSTDHAREFFTAVEKTWTSKQ